MHTQPEVPKRNVEDRTLDRDTVTACRTKKAELPPSVPPNHHRLRCRRLCDIALAAVSPVPIIGSIAAVKLMPT
jgi:hypothetical protein